MSSNSCTLKVHSRLNNSVSQPLRRLNIMNRESKKQNQRPECKTKVQRTRRQEVQPCPPRRVPLLDPVLKHEAHHAPREVIERRGGRDGTRGPKDERRHEELCRGVGPSLSPQVNGDGNNGANDEEDEEARVDAAG